MTMTNKFFDPPSLPGSAKLSDADWSNLEKVAECELSPRFRWCIDVQIILFRRHKSSCSLPPAMSDAARRFARAAKRAEMQAADMRKKNDVAAAQDFEMVAATARNAATARRRRTGRPGEPYLDDLILALSPIYMQASHAPTSAAWRAFLKCTCKIAGAKLQSDEAFAKRVETVCKGMTPAAFGRKRANHLRGMYAKFAGTPFGRYMASRAPYVVHASGRFADYLEALKRFQT